MRIIIILFPLVYIVGRVHSDVYNSLPYDRLLSKFNNVIDKVKANRGLITAFDKDIIEKIKQDMIEDCKTGKLQEYTGYERYDFKNVAGIPMKVYRVMLAEEASRDTYYWALPEVDCLGVSGRTNYQYIAPTPQPRGIPQNDVFRELPYSRLLSKFNKILDNIKANGGAIVLNDKVTLEQLKHDMIEDCKAGRLHEYAGYEKYDFRNYADIPTKVYHVRLAKEVTRDTYYWVLPQVDCNGLDGGVNYQSDDELDEYETGSEGEGSGGQRSGASQRLAGNDEFGGYITNVHHRFDVESKKSGATLQGVSKPPKVQLRVHVEK